MRFSESLKKTADFSIVYQKGKSAANRTLVLYGLRHPESSRNRLGISVSKKVGNSVRRNRARRLMRESMRQIGPVGQGYDIVLIARNTINDRKCADVKKSIEAALRKLKIK